MKCFLLLIAAMISLVDVTDSVEIRGSVHLVLRGATLDIPRGRYALLSPQIAARKPMIDLLAGTRPPASGRISWLGRPSWPIGRSGFARGKLTGHQIIALIARIYQADLRLSEFFVAEMMSRPQILDERIDHWDSVSRQELGYLLPLIPQFDTYLVDGVFPSRKDAFAMKWRDLFEERTAGRTVIVSSTRPNDVTGFCERAIVIENGHVVIEDQLEQLLERFPLRTFGAEPETTGTSTQPELDEFG